MPNNWRILKFALCLTVLFSFANDSSADKGVQDAFDDKSREIIANGVLKRQIRIMPQLNGLNFGLGRHDGISFYYTKSLSKIFFQDRIIDADITDIEFSDVKISLGLYHSVLGDGRIQFVFDNDFVSRTSDEDIQNVLLTTIGNENNKYVFGDPGSKMYHAYTCLDTKDHDELLRLTLEEAEKQGYQPCAFCFRKLLYLPDLGVEMEIEREWSARLRDYELMTEDSSSQRYLRELGERILQNWPFRLLGYDYSFQLIKSRKLYAVAIPTGKIVVSTALLDSVENKEAVEALLVLAISHIEKRHSLKQYRLKLASTKKSDIVKSLMQAAGSVAGFLPGGSLIGTIGSIPFNNSPGNQTSVFGFDDDFNKESDTIAALYFDRKQHNRNSLTDLIRKLQIIELAERLHPELGDREKEFYLNDRIKRVENAKFLYFEDKNNFVYKKNNRLPVQLDLLYQSLTGNENTLVVYLNDKSLLLDSDSVNTRKKISLLIQDKNGNQAFRLLEKFTTADVWGAQLTFKATGKKKQRLIQNIEAVKLIVSNTVNSGDRRQVAFLEHYTFVKGKLDY